MQAIGRPQQPLAEARPIRPVFVALAPAAQLRDHALRTTISMATDLSTANSFLEVKAVPVCKPRRGGYSRVFPDDRAHEE